MAMQINKPQRQQSAIGQLSSILSVANTVQGMRGKKSSDSSSLNDDKSTTQKTAEVVAASPKPGGLQKVAGLGEVVGGAITANPLLVSKGVLDVKGNLEASRPEYNPMQSRLASVQTDTDYKLQTLRNAEIYLNSASEEDRRLYGPALMETMLAAARQYKTQGRIG